MELINAAVRTLFIDFRGVCYECALARFGIAPCALGLSIIWSIGCAPLTESTLSVAASEEFLELVKSSLLAALEGSLCLQIPVKWALYRLFVLYVVSSAAFL